MPHRLPVALAALLALGASALAPRAARAATGGPDALGYTWADQDEPGVDGSIPPATGGPFNIPLGNDQVSAPIDLGFGFPFYGQTYTRLVVSDNGWISFDTTLADSHPLPAAIPGSLDPNRLIAWYWRDLTAPIIARWSPFAGGLYLQLVTSVPAGGTVGVYLVLYQSGMIKVRYDAVAEPATASLGIENEGGDTGLNPWYLGTGANGFLLADASVLVYYPRAQLDCSAQAAVGCNQTVSLSSPPSLNPNVAGYACSPGSYLGRETVIELTNPALADVTVTLSKLPGGVDLDLFLLRRGACNEFQCLAGGGDTATVPFLPAGSYRIVVDGKGVNDNGDFDLTVTCAPRSLPVACQAPGSPPVPGSTSGASQWTIYPCTNQTMDGGEAIVEVPFTAPGNLKAVLTPEPGVEMDLLLFGPDDFDAPLGCAAWGDSSLTLFDPPSGRYYLVVDGRTQGGTLPPTGSFELQVTCDVLLDCGLPLGDLLCSADTSGDTASGTNRAEQYSCSADLFTGPELVYRFQNPVERTVSFLWSGPPDLSLFLVGPSCNEGACLEHGNGRLIARDLKAGDYFLVVDGANGASGAFTITPICDNLVDPSTGSWTLDPGQTVHETKLVTLNADLTRGDVVFAMDLTTSMGIALDGLKATSQQIIDELAKVIDDVQFGLVSFEDYAGNYVSCGYAGGPYGLAGDSPYRLDLAVTNDLATLKTAIDGLTLGSGNDYPESYTRVWHELDADAAKIGWRPQARKIGVMIADDEPHSCDLSYCGQPRLSTGVDPGRDAALGTPDDLEILPVMADVKQQGITPIFLFTGNPQPGKATVFAQWQCYTQAGGGEAWNAPNGSLPAGLVEDLRDLIVAKSLVCDVLEVRPQGGFESWVTSVVPDPALGVQLPARLTFDFDLGPPAGTAPGTYAFAIDFVCDGVVKASQDVTITVPGLCSDPVGTIGNRLFAVKQGPDVLLDWSLGPLNPRSYNVHREALKTLLAPPASAPIGQAAGAEAYTDANAVPPPPALTFYETYGRACSGSSLFD